MSGAHPPDRPRDNDGDDEPTPPDPLAQMLSAMFGGQGTPGGHVPPELAEMLAGIPGMPTDPASLQAMFAQVQRLIETSEQGPVNWQMARDIARQVAAEGGDPSIGDGQGRQVAEALRTADLWLDRVTDLPSATARTEAWSRAEWIERTLPTWQGMVEPIADSVGAALAQALAGQAPEELRGAITEALPMMRSVGGTFFGLQLGQAIGALAREVVGGGDTALPLLDAGRAALLPTNIAAFGEGLELPADEVRLYLALREAAFARLVAAVPWLRSHILSAVTDYARGIQIDTDRIEAAVREVDPMDVEAMQKALSSGLFEPERTPGQNAALGRLETVLALVEGWVDEVVHAAARDSLPHAQALRETVRRRRAAGGPAEHTFASLVGLELRPRRLREAAAVWAALTEARGAGGRDELWRHPDLVPDEQAFSDPAGFARASRPAESADAMDAALAALLEQADDDQPDDTEP
jgi:putative hydrolase